MKNVEQTNFDEKTTNSQISDINNTFTKYTLNYELQDILGEGTFGKVYKGLKNSNYFGVKKIYRNEDGLHITTIREIRILRNTKHKNIIELLEINVDKLELYLVFPYYRFDLYKYLKKNIPNRKETLHIVKQIIDGLLYLKKNQILHRDIKSRNILLDINLNVKIADFGMATTTNKNSCYSPGVVTLWYRPPEILLNLPYDYACDIWGLGCILAEIMHGNPVFAGNTELSVLESIISVCGSINERILPNLKKMEFSLPQSTRNLRKIFKRCDDDLIDLLDDILVINPTNRPDIEELSNKTIFNDYDSEYINNIEKRYKHPC